MGTSYCLNRALISVLMDHRRSIGLHRNGVPAKLKKLIVRTHCLFWFEKLELSISAYRHREQIELDCSDC